MQDLQYRADPNPNEVRTVGNNRLNLVDKDIIGLVRLLKRLCGLSSGSLSLADLASETRVTYVCVFLSVLRKIALSTATKKKKKKLDSEKIEKINLKSIWTSVPNL